MQAVKEACDKVGGQSALAGRLGVKPAFVYQWLRGLRPIPAKYCMAIERETGVSRVLLRPDDWRDFWPELSHV